MKIYLDRKFFLHFPWKCVKIIVQRVVLWNINPVDRTARFLLVRDSVPCLVRLEVGKCLKKEAC